MAKTAACIACLLVLPGLGQAAPDTALDIHYFYDMRETRPERDGDITFINLATVEQSGATTRRLEAGIGFRNEFWGDHYPPAAHISLSQSDLVGDAQRGLAVRIIAAQGEWTSADIGYAVSHTSQSTDARLYFGVQALSSRNHFDTSMALSGFWHAEASYWVTPNIALRGALGGDDGSHIVSLATAMARPGWPVSLEAEYTTGLPEYRGNPDHTDFFVGFRWTGPDALRHESLRAREARLNARLFERPTEPN